MRENLEELNTQGLAEIPVLLGGAALTRTYVERDLREVYDGRLFYGKDAFEGLRTMDTLMEGKRSGALDPDFGRALGRPRSCRRRKSEMEAERAVDRRGGALRRRGRRRGLHAAVPRLTRRQGHLARRDRRVHQRDRAVPQPVAVPARQVAGRERRRVQGTHPPDAARAARRGQGRGLARARGGVGLLPGQLRRQRPRRVERRRPPQRAAAVHVPAAAQRPFLCIADFFRPVESGDADYAAFHVVTVGRARHRARARAVRRRPVPGLPAPPRPVGGDDRGARRAVAPAHPRGVGLRRRGRPDARRPVPPAVPRARATRGATPRAPTSTTRRSSTSCSSWTASA